ncbi:MAG TPA: hypothetical protein VE861_14635 [Gemmatimonadaceae bacterium]|nr:hypothetical protein [Gemmatimonadaceae bacterium]
MTWRGLARLIAVCLTVALPAGLEAQTPVAPVPAPVRLRPDGFDLGQSSPNPTAGDTRFPFFVGDPPVCRDSRRQYRVTLRIYNLLAQEVAVAQLTGPNGELEGARRLNGVMLTCRQYQAYWDGRVDGTQRDAPDGIYLYRLEVNGRAVVKKLVVHR